MAMGRGTLVNLLEAQGTGFFLGTGEGRPTSHDPLRKSSRFIIGHLVPAGSSPAKTVIKTIGPDGNSLTE